MLHFGWISVVDLIASDIEDLLLTVVVNMIQEQSDAERQLWDGRVEATRGYPSNMQHTWNKDRRKRREYRHYSNLVVYSKIEHLIGVDFVDERPFRDLIQQIESNKRKAQCTDTTETT